MFSEAEFNAIAERYMDSIFRLALNYTKNYSEAEDITQNVLIKIFRTSKGFESSEHLRYWIFRVTVNECKRAVLAPWRKTDSIEELGENISFEESHSRELFEAVMELPKKYRVPIYLYYYEGYSTREIAKLLNIAEATVRTQMKRGREQLRLNLGGDINE